MLINKTGSKPSARRQKQATALTFVWLSQGILSAALASPGQSVGVQLIAAAPVGQKPAAIAAATVPLPVTTPMTSFPKPVQTSWLTIRDAVKDGKVSLKVVGDGVHTSHVRLALTNKTALPIVVFIPANEILQPGNKSIQKMMMRRSSALKLAPGATNEFELGTVCASVKSIPPPPGQPSDYTAGPYGDEKTWKQMASIVAAADQLDSKDLFHDVPLKNERKEQIAQFAIWRVLGLASGNPDDAVTPESIESDLLRLTGETVKKDPKRMAELGEGYQLNNKGELIATGKRKKQLEDQVINPIFAAIDLTVRKSQDPGLKNVAPLPTNSAWDTFIGAGERAYNNGEFIEASEVLEAAATEAEKFGEADPRLSRSLVSKGMCFLDFGNYEGAESDFKKALHLREKTAGKQSLDVAEVDNDLGTLKQRVELYDPAQNYFQNALDIVDKAANVSPPVVAQTLDNLGKNYNLKGEGERAEPLLKRAMAVAMLSGSQEGAKTLITANPDVAEVETNLAYAYMLMGNFVDAKRLYEKALSTDTTALGGDHPFIAQILDGIGTVLTKTNQPQAAEPYKRKAQEIREKTLGKNQQIASLPLSYDVLTRVQLYSSGAKEISATMDKFVLEGEVLKAPSLDKVRINRPIKSKWALVVGISKFQDQSINLKYAAKDAQDFASYLEKEGKFEKDHVHVLLNEQATRENILAEIGDKFLPRTAAPDDLVVIYLSSHGSPSKVDTEGVNYFVAYNTDKNSLYATGIPMVDLTKMIKERVHSDRVVVVLDACHSGAANVAKGLYRAANFDANSIAQGAGQLVICSSRPDQVSWESKRYQNGVFTHYLLEGLRKSPTAKLGDAVAYMQDQVLHEVQLDRNGEMQQPVLKSSWEGDDLILAVPPTEQREGIPQDITPEPTQASTPAPAGKSISGSAATKSPAIHKAPGKPTVH
jgi:tetratricopeptide (TPR) repeat protein